MAEPFGARRESSDLSDDEGAGFYSHPFAPRLYHSSRYSLIITAPFHSNSRRSNGHTAPVIAFILTFCLVAFISSPPAHSIRPGDQKFDPIEWLFSRSEVLEVPMKKPAARQQKT